MKKIVKLPIDRLRTDGGTQPRVKMSDQIITDYAESLHLGAVFPPVIVFFDEKDYWLADGFHRRGAHLKAGRKTIDADVKRGTQRDALLYSVGANAAHGLRRTTKDKQQSIRIMLQDEEWSGWSDQEIAEHCGVDGRTVAKHRAELSSEIPKMRKVSRNGVTYTMDTSKIGAHRADEAENRLEQALAAGEIDEELAAALGALSPEEKLAVLLNSRNQLQTEEDEDDEEDDEGDPTENALLRAEQSLLAAQAQLRLVPDLKPCIAQVAAVLDKIRKYRRTLQVESN